MSKQAFDDKIAALEELRSKPEIAVATLRKALKDRSNFAVGRAATIAGDLLLSDLVPDLLAAFDRALVDPKSDSQCWAKNGIAKALKDLGYRDADPFLSGLRHIQMEPVWGGQVDTAATLRGTSALALVDCQLDDLSMLSYLAEALADSEKSVRVDAAVALSRAGIPEAIALLRFKALVGDPQAEVLGQCFYSLLQMAPRDSVAFVARFLSPSYPQEVRAEAASALAQSHEASAIEALKSFSKALLSPELRKALWSFLAASPQREAAEFLYSIDTRDSREALKTSRFRNEFA